MKKFLKFLGITALAAALVPCRVEKDEETGKKTYQSLLCKLDIGPGKNGEGTEIGLSLADGVIPSAIRAKKEDDQWNDVDPELDIDDDFDPDVDEDDFCDEPEGDPILEVSLTVHKDQGGKAVDTEPAPESIQPEG